MLASRVRKANVLARIGVAPAQNYGNTAMGVCPKIARIQTSNMALASGLGTHTVASATLAIE